MEVQPAAIAGDLNRTLEARAMLSRLRERISTSYFAIPALSVALAGVLAVLLVQVDESVNLSKSVVGFSGSSTSARALLSTIASSIITLTGLVFSITIVVLQLTSSQFSPRVIRTFLRDRRSQFTLGVFLATFVYSLSALREVRDQNGSEEQFVPDLTITVAFSLALISVVMLVMYIHHITLSIRVVNIIEWIAKESEGLLEQQYGDEKRSGHPGARCSLPQVPSIPVDAGSKGVLTDVDIDELVDEAARCDVVLTLVPRIGQFVPMGTPLLHVHGATDAEMLNVERLRRLVALGRERTMQMDLAFGFRQLVDVAEKALSPGINDPTTAIQCLDQIHNLLRQLMDRNFPYGCYHDEEGNVRLFIDVFSFDDFLHLALDEIRHWGAGSLQVHQRIRQILSDLMSRVQREDQLRALNEQLRLLDSRLHDLPESERTPFL